MAYTVATDTLPDGIELVGKTSQRVLTDNIGTILPGASVTKTYQVKVTAQTDGETITNKAFFTADSIVKDNPQSGCSTAAIKVSNTPKPVYACNLLSVDQSDSRVATLTKLDVTATNGASLSNVVIDWGISVPRSRHRPSSD